MTDGPVAALLVESFAMLADELPAAHERMSARLAGRVVDIRVGSERFLVESGPRGPRVRAPGGGDEVSGGVVIATTRRAILDVIDARRSLSESVMSDDVEAVAPLDTLVEVLGGLSTYVHGAVRCPSFPSLLERFRRLLAEPSPAAATPDDGRRRQEA